MHIKNLSIPDVKLITLPRYKDNRGFFQQSYQREQYIDAGIDVEFVQENWSRSTKGVLRGMHYQYKHAQSKLVSVTRGAVFDVAVDMRKNSPTFGQWVGEVLSDENNRQLFVPKGFAHGFLVLSDTVDFVYKCDDYYTPGDEYGVIWNDTEIEIGWPNVGAPVVSEKDAECPVFSAARTF